MPNNTKAKNISPALAELQRFPTDALRKAMSIGVQHQWHFPSDMSDPGTLDDQRRALQMVGETNGARVPGDIVLWPDENNALKGLKRK